MSTHLDMTRIVRSWLRTDEHESADRVLDNVLALLDATPQHRAQWPVRRFVDMNAYLKLAIAAAAVVVVALVGYNLLPTRPTGGVGGTQPSPSLSAATIQVWLHETRVGVMARVPPLMAAAARGPIAWAMPATGTAAGSRARHR